MATLTSASSVMEGGSIDFTLTLDAPTSTATSYSWFVAFGGDATALLSDFEALSGVFVVAAGESEQTFTVSTRLRPVNAGDRAFIVSIRDSMNDEVVESDLITLEDTEGQASFSIRSDNNVDIPLVGDELTLSLDAVDPQGNINSYSYQWYDATDDTDITGATGTRYTITDPGQIIGVRVTYTDRGGVEEVVTVELGSASSVTPVVDPSDYVVVQESDGNGAETLAGTSSDEIIQGGNKGDVISTGGGDDIIIGGYGRDRITLDDGAETIVYRFASPVASDDKWTAVDGADTVRNFKRGVDKLVFVDVGETPVDLARFITLANALHGITRLEVELELIDNGNVLRGVKFKFSGNGFDDGPGSDDSSGKWLRIYFEETVTLFNPDGSITEEGIKLVGENGAGFNADTHLLTDFALLSEYFHDRFDVTTEGQLGLAITDVDAVYVIDNADSGEAEHITDTVGLHVGSTLYARVLSNDPDTLNGDGAPSYQWKRGGVDIVGATDAAYTLVDADEDESLTVTVTYRNDVSNTFESVTSAAVLIPHNEGVSDFVIASNGDVNAPTVGDVLRVDRSTADPDGNGDGALSYQWFVMGGDDIAGAISHTYTLTDPDQIIGVRVTYIDGDGYSETAAPVLNIASRDVGLFDHPRVIQIGDGSGEDTLAGTLLDELILGGDDDDTITTGGGNDFVIGGNGRDRITLDDDGAETIIYHFSSDGDWTAVDGRDMVNDFERGVDKLVLVDVANDPIDLATLLESENEFSVEIDFEANDRETAIDQILFVFQSESDNSDGNIITIRFKDLIVVADSNNNLTPQGEIFLGIDGAGFDTATGKLTDFSLLPNYFGEGFDDGLQVIASDDVAAAFPPPVLDPSDHTLVKDGDGSGEDTLAGTSADDIIQGGNNDDVITTGGGSNIVIGGYGRDRITLDDGAETIVYRFASPVASDDKWTAVDGADTVRNFKRGVDKLVFVDVGETPVDLARFITLANAFHGITRLEVELELIDNGNVLRGVTFKFSGNGFDDGPGSDDSSGKWLRIYFEETVTLFNPDGSITEEGIKLVGENGVGFNADTHLLTDFTLLSEYFHDRFDVTTEGQLGVAITDFPAVYVIDDSNRGSVEQVTASNLVAGTKLYARALRSDPDADGGLAYQWMRNGRDIAGATQATYTITKVDEGDSLSVVVTYRNGVSETDESVTSAAVSVPTVSDGGGSFTIISVNDVPRVGDVLSVSQSQDDPDGNGDGTFSYQWFIAGAGNIAGATEPEHRITEAGQIIGVRVTYTDDEGYDQTVSTKLSVASIEPVVNPFVYTNAIQIGDGSGVNILDGTVADELFQGGAGDDIITTSGGVDIVIGGHGNDTILLGEDNENGEDGNPDGTGGVETIVYRFTSSGDSGWTAVDGDDVVHNFERGIDKFVFVDVDTDTSVDLATFLESEGKFSVVAVRSDEIIDATTTITGVVFLFTEGATSGLTIRYQAPIDGVFDSTGDVTEKGEKFFGVEGASFNSANGEITDFSLLPNYFGEGFDDGLQVIKPSELGVDII